MSSVSQVNASTASTTTTSSTDASQGLDQNAFLQLLMTQMQNQDPTQPMDDSQFIAQLAQFSSLEQMTQVNTQMGTVSSELASANAFSLVGATISATNPTTNAIISGTVSSVVVQNGQPELMVGTTQVDPSWVTTVQ